MRFRAHALGQTVGLFTVGSVVFGIAHDLVTAHVAVDYFTVHHPRLVPSESPVVMALLWGILATFWVGAIGGAFVGIINSVRQLPVPVSRIRRALVRVLIGIWVSSMAVLGAVLLFAHSLPIRERKPSFEHDARLVAVAITHAYSYFAAAVAIVGFALFVALARPRTAES